MKKLSILLILLVMCFSLAACSSNSSESSTPSSDSSTESEQSSSESDSNHLKSGDSVSIVGQVAVTIRDDGDTISVQVQRKDGRWVIYHCQLKADFVEKAKEFKMSDVAKVNGSFLSMTDLEQENTAIIVNLYDCELTE